MALARPVYIVAAKRTAFGAFGGKVKDLSATVLAQKATTAALQEAKLDPGHVNSVIFGNVIQVSGFTFYFRNRHCYLQILDT